MSTLLTADPKPEGYIAREVIYGLLAKMEAGGVNIDAPTINGEILRRIEIDWNYKENPNTVSSYKSQYKAQKKAQERSELTHTTNVKHIIQASRKIERLLREFIEQEDIDRETLIEIVSATLDEL